LKSLPALADVMGRITVVQPALPAYRRAFFERLARQFGSRFAVYASPEEGLGLLADASRQAEWERPLGAMRPLLPGLEWQTGALSIPIERGDVLIVCGAPRCLSTLALIAKGKLKGARTIWWGHYWSATSRPWRAAIRYALMRIPDGILFYTQQEVAEYRAERRREHGKPVYGLDNGIETDDIVRLRALYHAGSRPRDLLFIGRLTPKAELGLLLDALALSACAGVTLDVIGGGEEEDALRRRCAELGLPGRVSFHGATTEEPRIAAIANSCKAFVYPGGVGLSLIHALAYGLPAIVHDNRWTHMPEIAALQAGVNGATFHKGDAASLAGAIAGLLADPAKLDTMSAAAATTTDNSFNAAAMSARFCAAIEKQFDQSKLRAF
jgi:glycosyltransferase involved in cell wall biosynthesis